jgi:hypothetical protein
MPTVFEACIVTFGWHDRKTSDTLANPRKTMTQVSAGQRQNTWVQFPAGARDLSLLHNVHVAGASFLGGTVAGA